MASVLARITSALLSAVFHSRFIKNENMSANAGAAVENKVSRYKPPKGYTMTRTPCGAAVFQREAAISINKLYFEASAVDMKNHGVCS